jgi:class 3 adenylate cyclase/tetratricopeptide (TPR) repeat protein
MQACASCRHDNPPDAHFCNRCGTPLTGASALPEQLKTITVLFADVTGSTELGERLDPEAVRRVMERYFELAQRVITRHGGTVEKFIGDAVMAVFGVPTIHEDDALRAIRAAADLRAELPGLNVELRRDYGTTLELRLGVNTGEAVTATDEWLAVGDAVNIAARLEQAAAPGEVLLGPQTVGLVRDAVAVEPLEPMALKGKSHPVAVSRLVEVLVEAGSPRRRFDAPMVGRSHQLRMLEDFFLNGVRERTCGLFTLLGVAGVGKSRLVAEFIRRLDATVVAGRCLSYGEGITYWPVVEVVRQLLANPGVDGDALAGSGDQARTIRALLGESAPAGTSAEIAWAVRKLFERAAARRPLVVVFDDVHWAEQTFFDLVEHVADLSRGAPLLLLCMGRPELLERRPAWGGGKLNATTVLLEPLNADEADELIDRLLPAGTLAGSALRTRALEAAAGNPLFLEEIAAVASSGGDIGVPPTIQALLAARLDQLEPGERRVLERGSVEGNSFHRGAVEALGPEEASVPSKLVTLVRKDLVRPDEASLPGDDAFRFRHLLIRDAAYDGLPKSVRAQLHETFANWLDQRASDLAERDEIIGYHLEQAYGYRRELGPVDAAAQAVAAAAAHRLESAGRRALDRGDASAALNLLERANSLLSSGRADISLELSVVWAMFEAGRISDAAARAGTAAARAAEAGDRTGQLRAELARLDLLLHLEPEGGLAQLEDLVERARPVLEQDGDHAALASLWMAAEGLEHYRCRFGAAADAALRAVEHATAAGEEYLASWGRVSAASGIADGPMPVAEALSWLDQQSARLEPRPTWIDFRRSRLLALIGRFEEARAAHESNVEQMTELGDRLGLAVGTAWWIEMEAGQFARAEEAARQSCRLLEEMAERSFWSTKACNLAQALYFLGRYDEAGTWARQGADAGATDDACTQMLSRQVLAKVAARGGQFETARTLAAEALAISERMDAPLFQGVASLDAAEALLLAGDRAGAIREAERAAALFKRKGATVPLGRALRFLETMASGVT